jgi:hypothetical protein
MVKWSSLQPTVLLEFFIANLLLQSKESIPANHISLVQWRLYLLYVKPALASVCLLSTPGLNTDRVEKYPT